MAYTTCKILKEDSLKLKEIKLRLEKQNIKATQPQLLHEAVELLEKNKVELIKKLGQMLA